jgi:hypothetical protein
MKRALNRPHRPRPSGPLPPPAPAAAPSSRPLATTARTARTRPRQAARPRCLSSAILATAGRPRCSRPSAARTTPGPRGRRARPPLPRPRPPCHVVPTAAPGWRARSRGASTAPPAPSQRGNSGARAGQRDESPRASHRAATTSRPPAGFFRPAVARRGPRACLRARAISRTWRQSPPGALCPGPVGARSGAEPGPRGVESAPVSPATPRGEPGDCVTEHPGRRAPDGESARRQARRRGVQA